MTQLNTASLPEGVSVDEHGNVTLASFGRVAKKITQDRTRRAIHAHNLELQKKPATHIPLSSPLAHLPGDVYVHPLRYAALLAERARHSNSDSELNR